VARKHTLRRVGLGEIGARRASFEDARTIETARAIMEAVRRGGEPALAGYAASLDGNAGRLWYGPEDFAAALASIPAAERNALEAAAGRIRAFAQAQLSSLSTMAMPVPGGTAGHEILPIERAGCYAPGGRYPLPSSVLMTAIPARVAGVTDLAVACPRPESAILAACALAGADRLLAAGGAQAIAAFAYGAGPLTPRDLVVGPGNRYVAAAKLIAQAVLKTDAPAGPSELLVLADDSADPEALAWDLLAQAEHDPDALACLATDSAALADALEDALARALRELKAAAPGNAENAEHALSSSWLYLARAEDAAAFGLAGELAPVELAIAEAANRFCPEHLELALADPERLRPYLRHAGALFLGARSAEAFGDYGAGPNHALPTAGRSRSSGGLSVFDFVRIRTWLRLDDEVVLTRLAADSAALARLEGLEAHARSAEARAARRLTREPRGLA
jgi:phosphoribosyl-ATP pyrophosphohydrolase/phosphoribosyl-AMP cyclohydrolase/histidinol dehydrogenase